VVDVGPLAESWRIQPGTPGYVERLNAKELTAALASVERGR
jgi:8-hydroxy-5-deazaflavin:NADPH oxidoreductase